MTTGPQRSPLPTFIDPMLATLGTLPPAALQDQWGYEMKWDGVRALVRVDAGQVTLTSRNKIDMTVGYPEAAGLGKQLAGRQAILDGEIVALDSEGKPSFSRLQKRMHVNNAASARELAKSDPTVLLLFDLLHLDGGVAAARFLRRTSSPAGRAGLGRTRLADPGRIRRIRYRGGASEPGAAA